MEAKSKKNLLNNKINHDSIKERRIVIVNKGLNKFKKYYSFEKL